MLSGTSPHQACRAPYASELLRVYKCTYETACRICTALKFDMESENWKRPVDFWCLYSLKVLRCPFLSCFRNYSLKDLCWFFFLFFVSVHKLDALNPMNAGMEWNLFGIFQWIMLLSGTGFGWDGVNCLHSSLWAVLWICGWTSVGHHQCFGSCWTVVAPCQGFPPGTPESRLGWARGWKGTQLWPGLAKGIFHTV